MDRQYAPVPGTAIKSPGPTSSGKYSSFTTISTDTKSMPTTLLSTRTAGDRREARLAESCALYHAGRMLSLIPPSTDTYRRAAPPSSTTSLTVPTSYNVHVDGPAIARPGSTARRGTSIRRDAHSSVTIWVMLCANSYGDAGSSWVV